MANTGLFFIEGYFVHVKIYTNSCEKLFFTDKIFTDRHERADANAYMLQTRRVSDQISGTVAFRLEKIICPARSFWTRLGSSFLAHYGESRRFGQGQDEALSTR